MGGRTTAEGNDGSGSATTAAAALAFGLALPFLLGAATGFATAFANGTPMNGGRGGLTDVANTAGGLAPPTSP